jgi:class 3 adenylate cyclase
MTTTAPLEDLACYVPSLILRRMSAEAGITMAPAVERFPAAVLFADLSGFTALTEHLTQHSPAGAEELTRILDLYFGHLVQIVLAHGGDVVKFAGDGLLALWYGDEPLATLAQRAVQCGLSVQMVMAPDAWGSVDGAAPPPDLKVRVGVGAGEVTTMHLGGVFGRWELLVTGDTLAQTGRAESEARPGEVLITPAAWPLVAERCVGHPLPSGAVRLDGLADYIPMRGLAPPPLLPEMAEALRAYLPKAILSRLDAGQTAWLAEQRRVTVLFVNLPNLSADTPLRQAQALMRALQTSLYRFEGSITRLGTDAKGPTLVAALGLPPFSHEDDPERGVRAALAIHQSLRELGFACAIGVTTGRALCGAVGAQRRREYTMMGSMVNRSARLMQAAGSGALAGGLPILCDEATFRAARAHLHFEPLPPMRLKGVAAPVTVYKALPTGEQPGLAPRANGAPRLLALLGRERDQELLAERIELLADQGSGGAVIVEGEAGIGKSALLAYARDLARERGLRVASGSGSPVEMPAYHPWRPIFVELLDGSADGGDQLGALLPHRAAVALDALEARDLAPLLAPLLGLDIAETPRTAQLVGQVRADNTRDLLLRLLGHFASRARLVLVFDDAHWLDPSSWALLQAAAEQIPAMLALVAARPLVETPPAFQRLAYSVGSLRLQLRGLPPAAVRDLLARRLGVAAVPEPVWQLIAARSQGNPFVAEELLHTLRERGAIVVADGICRLGPGLGGVEQALAGVQLPDTVEGLIISRIDRLSAAQQLTLKVASVIGPSFSLAALEAIHPVERDRERLVEQLFALQQAGLVLIESFEPDLVYAFKHAVGAEVAYNLMSFGQRRRLHRALAERYEAPDFPERVPSPQLAHHWRRADEPLRAICYLARAGEEALRAGAYAEAAVFLADALQILDGAEPGASDEARALWERQLGEAYHGMGRLIESRELLERSVARLGFPWPRDRAAQLADLAGELVRQAANMLLRARQLPHAHPGAAAEAARAYALLAQLAYYDGQMLASTFAALRGLNLAERAGPSPELARAYASAHLAAGFLPPLAAAYRGRAQAVARRLRHLPTEAWVAEAQGLHDAGQARWRRAQGALGLALAIGERLGDQRRCAEALAGRSLVYAHRGAFGLALAGCEELQVLGLRTGDLQVRTWGLIGAAENLLALGEGAPAEQLLGEAETLLTANFNGARAEEVWAYALMGRAALRRGAHELARAVTGAAAGLLGPVPPATLYALGGYSAVAEVYLGLLEARFYAGSSGRRAVEEAAARACRGLARFALIFPVARPGALIWEGLRLQLGGSPGRARRRWLHAVALAAQLGMPYDEARARYQLGRHAGGGERREQLERAGAIFERLGCAHDLAATRRLLA